MKHFITQDMPVTEEVLNVIANLPTKSLPAIVEDKFFVKLNDHDIMRIAVLLAQKSYDEGGCPIGGIIIDSQLSALPVNGRYLASLEAQIPGAISSGTGVEPVGGVAPYTAGTLLRSV